MPANTSASMKWSIALRTVRPRTEHGTFAHPATLCHLRLIEHPAFDPHCTHSVGIEVRGAGVNGINGEYYLDERKVKIADPTLWGARDTTLDAHVEGTEYEAVYRQFDGDGFLKREGNQWILTRETIITGSPRENIKIYHVKIPENGKLVSRFCPPVDGWEVTDHASRPAPTLHIPSKHQAAAILQAGAKRNERRIRRSPAAML